MLWMATKHILWPGDVKCDFLFLWMSAAEDYFFSLQEKECWSLQVILKMELQVLVRNELGNIKGGRGKMQPSISPASQASKLARWGSLREETVQHCNHLFSEEESFQFMHQAGRLFLPTSKERSFDAHPSNLTFQISGKTVGNGRFSYYSATENQGKQSCRGNAVIAALLMAAKVTAGARAATDQH